MFFSSSIFSLELSGASLSILIIYSFCLLLPRLSTAVAVTTYFPLFCNILDVLIGVTIVYQSNDSKTKYEADVTEMIGTLSYADESVKALDTINMYSQIFNIYNSVINYHEPVVEETTPSDEQTTTPESTPTEVPSPETTNPTPTN